MCSLACPAPLLLSCQRRAQLRLIGPSGLHLGAGEDEGIPVWTSAKPASLHTALTSRSQDVLQSAHTSGPVRMRASAR